MPLFWLSLSFLGGILVAANLPLPTHVWLYVGGILLPVSFALRLFYRRKREQLEQRLSAFMFHNQIPLFLLPIFMILGAVRYQAAQPVFNPDFIAWYNDWEDMISIEGIIILPPDERDLFTNLKVRVLRIQESATSDWQIVNGIVLAIVPPGEMWHYGEQVWVQGYLKTPGESETFSYRDYLAHQNIYSLMSAQQIKRTSSNRGNPLLSAIYALKERALTFVFRIFPEPEASLLAGILLGEDQRIPQHVLNIFQATGTAHIIAISGFNMTIVAGLFLTTFGRFLGKRWGFLVALVGISTYAILVGASPSVIRAAIMSSLSIIAYQIGRRQTGLNSLAITVGIMAFVQPEILWDVSFQLSFMATLGLMLYADPIKRGVLSLVGHLGERAGNAIKRYLIEPLGEYLFFTLAAQLTTLPVLIYHFQRVSLITFLANLIVLPVQPAIMVLGGIALLSSLVYLPLGQIIAYLALPLVTFTIRVVAEFANIPGGSLTLDKVSLITVMSFYTALFGLTFARQQILRLSAAIKPALLLSLLAILNIVVWRVVFTNPDSKLHMTLFAGGDNTILIQAPNGGNLLINSGTPLSLLADKLGERLPVTERQLDWHVITANTEAQIDSLPATMKRFPASQVLWAGQPIDFVVLSELIDNLYQDDRPALVAEPGQVLALGLGASLHVLTVGRRGGVFLIEWDNFRALLPIGLDFQSLEDIFNNPELRDVTVLLLAEGGYPPLNPPELFNTLHPRIILVSLDPTDPDAGFMPETEQAVDGYTVLRTDKNGWIHLSTDGKKLWVEVERR